MAHYPVDSFNGNQSPQKTISFLPLGDSYTICEGVQKEKSWPYLLSQFVFPSGIQLKLLDNPAVTGYTTSDLIEQELPVFDREKPEFCTLLIGVNDWVQGVPEAVFKKNLQFIIRHILTGLAHPKRLVLITIPDFSLTPEGPKYANGRNIREGIKAYNQIIQEEAVKNHLIIADIFPISDLTRPHPEMVAPDGLHPSAKMYALWETEIREKTEEALSSF